MKVSIKYANAIMQALKDQTQQNLDIKGLKAIADEMNNKVEWKYLYDSLIVKPKLATEKKQDSVGLNTTILDNICQFLEFKNFKEFCAHIDNPLSEQLISLEGCYYSYVRQNSPDTVILRSPVKMSLGTTEMKFLLKGPSWEYEGAVRLDQGCIFILMKASSGKEFHHVYGIGKKFSPGLLKGVISGESTSDHPIGGRVVLIRQDKPWNKLSLTRLTPNDLKISEDQNEKTLTEYFKHYQDNNLRVDKAMTFSLEDLKS